MNSIKHIIKGAGCALTLLLSVACSPFSQQQQQTQLPPEPPKPVWLPGSYEYFVQHHGYPKTMHIFQNKELLSIANKKCPIYIDLQNLRGRLYVNGQVAADWPISTGTTTHPTRPGKFSIIEKKEKYASNRYGKIYDANGKCVNYNADFTKDPVPEGGRIEGSPMPYWQRLTHDGIGMHIGKVRAGRRLSHGCIRTPALMAKQLFRITGHGTKVYVTETREACYPATAAQAIIDAEAERAAKAAAEVAAKAQKAAAENVVQTENT